MLFRSLLLTLLFVGCSVQQPSPKVQQQKINTLSSMLSSLHPTVDRGEAYHLAYHSVMYSQKLADEYDVVPYPWINNTLVNMGIKKRGLCHQWTEDLLRFLVQQNYQSFDFHPVSANVGHLNEHNALVVSLKGYSFRKGVLLDAWRYSGDLYFISVEKDPSYKWFERRGLYGRIE
jgi:hypothetical protein